MTAQLTRTVRTFGALAAASLLTFSIAQGCASEGETNLGDKDDDGGVTAGVGGSSEGGSAPGSGGLGPSTTTTGGQGGTGNTIVECGEEISEANLESLPADLIVIVDNTDSMAFEAGQVKTQMNGLVTAITATGIDARVVLISDPSDGFIFNPLDTGVCLPAPLGSGSCPDDENLPNFRHINQSVGNNDALALVISTYDQWKTTLRPNAIKTFLVVSDDESGMTAAEFTSALALLDPPITDFTFNAITASENSLSCAGCIISGCGSCTNPCCDQSLLCAPLSSEQGQIYEELQSQTTGVYGDLCSQDFVPVFSAMAAAVIEKTTINCTFDIPTPPDGTVVPNETNVDFIPTPGATPQGIFNVATAADCGINGGWYFDSNTNPTKITLCPTTCNNVEDSTEGSVRVKYGCATEQVPS